MKEAEEKDLKGEYKSVKEGGVLDGRLSMKSGCKIKSVNEAIKYLKEIAGIRVVNIKVYKYKVLDEDFECYMRTNKELIDYANEQKEAIQND